MSKRRWSDDRGSDSKSNQKPDEGGDEEEDEEESELDGEAETRVAKRMKLIEWMHGIESIDLLPWLPVTVVVKLIAEYAKPLMFVSMKFATPDEVDTNDLGLYAIVWLQWTGNELPLTKFQTALEDGHYCNSAEIDLNDRVDEFHTDQTRGANITKVVRGRFKRSGNSIPHDFFDGDPFDSIDQMFE